MKALQPSDFKAFFQALYGYEPFPWQLALAKQVCNEGCFPDVLDLPTGTGKTACIEIALFHLAYDIARGDGARNAPLRIVWVVDRRLVVDEAFERARKLAEKLEKPEVDILKTVADLFSTMAGSDGPPLVVQRLRGGMPREGDWARTPTQPTVISSTVDQIGSRLLFRGYGVKPRMRPVNAGLLGEDTLIVLDEVHLAEPFRQTLSAVALEKRTSHTPWQYIQLSATPRVTTSSKSFRLTEDDEADPLLHGRLFRPKPTKLLRLNRVRYGSVDHAERFAEEAARLAFGAPTEPKAVLVVVNRVDLARRVHEAVLKRAPSGQASSTVLMIGRNRGVSKDRIRDEILGRCKSDPLQTARSERRSSFVVVATQCVEAGADLDFDALITQIAPLDALRQRFGRLNRMGRPIVAEGVILAVDDELSASSKPDPLYGFAPRETWRWLESKLGEDETVDFAPMKLKVNEEEQVSLSGSVPNAPVLMPEHVRAFSRTNPAPMWSPEPSLYLHGAPNSPEDVNVIWRADLSQSDADSLVENVLSLMPPRIGEAVSLPIRIVRRWLSTGSAANEIVDVDMDITDGDEKDTGALRKAWRWRGDDADVTQVLPAAIRPGDTIVVASTAGGCDKWGWNPEATFVDDLADDAAQPYAGRSYAVRLHKALFERTVQEEQLEVPASWGEIAEEIDRAGANARTLLSKLAGSDNEPGIALPQSLKNALQKLVHAKGKVTVNFAYTPEDEEPRGPQGVILFARRGLRNQPAFYESATEGDRIGSQGCGERGESLVSHSASVRDRAQAFARILRVPSALADDIALAAFLHDVGKADLRFQQYLAGSPWITDIAAKSGKLRTKTEDVRAWSEAGLPADWRHEALSVRIAREHEAFSGASDPELVLWLIGTHHGFGRPMFPHEEPRDEQPYSYHGFADHETVAQALALEPSAGPQRIDFELRGLTNGGPSRVDWQMMFHRLEQRYGSWGLAWLESIVRLADHRASEAGARVKVKTTT